MADESDKLQEVQPGELITSGFINGLIRKVNALSGTGPVDSGIEVPTFFGRTLSEALRDLTRSESKLRLGTVLDAAGLVVDTSQANNGPRLIIGQMPSALMRVPANTPVHLLLAISTSALTPPQIDSFVPPKAAPMGEKLEIHGENFASDPADNTVTFNEKNAGRPLAGTTRVLLVRIPTGIGGAPARAEDPETTVLVKVTTRQGSGTREFIISPPLPPRIDSFEPRVAIIGKTLRINGENFASDPADNTVTFDEENAGIPRESTPELLIVNVPTTIPGAPTQPGDRKEVTVKVTTPRGSGTGKVSITPPQPPPRISRFEPSEAPIGTDVKIQGENFAPEPADNKVTFDKEEAVIPLSASNTELLVHIPVIPDAPTDPTEKKQVTVKVTTPNGSGTGEFTLISLPPRIDSIEPSEANFEEMITIRGANFGRNVNDIRVYFYENRDDQSTSNNPDFVTVSQDDKKLPTSFSITLPQMFTNISIGPGGDKPVYVRVRVVADDWLSEPKEFTLKRPER